MAPFLLLKLVRPLVLLPLTSSPPSRKFIWSAALVSLVNWNSGVVKPAEASTPGNR